SFHFEFKPPSWRNAFRSAPVGRFSDIFFTCSWSFAPGLVASIFWSTLPDGSIPLKPRVVDSLAVPDDLYPSFFLKRGLESCFCADGGGASFFGWSGCARARPATASSQGMKGFTLGILALGGPIPPAWPKRTTSTRQFARTGLPL